MVSDSTLVREESFGLGFSRDTEQRSWQWDLTKGLRGHSGTTPPGKGRVSE